jgi:hypothetical protein
VSDLTTLSALELALRDLSHDERAVEVVRQFAANLGKTKQRQQVFNAPGALVRTPLDYDEALASGTIAPTEDRFSFLQGDIVSTDAAYLLGNRLTGMKFVIASATCDLVPARREYAALLRIQPISIDTPQAANLLGQLLKFRNCSTQKESGSQGV